MSLQVCSCCGWSKVTTYQGLRIHQGKMGCTPRGMRIPESEQFTFNTYLPNVTYMGPPIKVEEPLVDIFTPIIKSGGEDNNWRNVWRESRQKDSEPIKKENVSVFPNLTTSTIPAPTEAELMKMLASWYETQRRPLQTATNSDKTLPALDFTGGAQVSQTFSPQANPAEVKLQETNHSFFETPQRSQETATKARRALVFSTGAQQVRQPFWDPPTTTAQETAVRPKEKEKEKEREAQKLLKARQDRIRADLQQKIQMREQKMAEVTSSVKACKGSLDTEWLEINTVFSDVMRVVEDARRKALQPLEKRRSRVKREAQDLVEKLQKDIDKLKWTIDELDRNPDVKVSPLTGLDESRDWKNITLDTSFSFGSLRSTTSNMMEQIDQKLEKLSPVELKRTSTFAVDVKLDPTTAHPCLVLSPDGKKVRDGGKSQKAPDSPERFDKFGSVLGLNRLTSGKSYWEVEVNNKTGWDLGVARGDANRKGELELMPDNGYWVVVHYEDEKYAALTAPPVSLSLAVKPQRVGVFVDYEEGLVSFYDVTAQSHIYSFTESLFGDEIFPYFSPHLKQNGKNSDPLIICDV